MSRTCQSESSARSTASGAERSRPTPRFRPPITGGPLVDIAGRVLGVLVPLSPDTASEVAGIDWYDSGIGFAIPLDHVQRILPRWSAGEDLYTGILGVNLKGADPYTQPAVIAASRANSPAYHAGLQAGDTIVEINGQPVTRQAQLKQQLNRFYAGEKVKLVVLRGEQRIERELELIDKLEPYEYPFLGILPVRPLAGQPAGLVVRYVYPDSPAAKAGIQPGDQIATLAGREVRDAAAANEILRSVPVGAKVPLEVRRDGKSLALPVETGRLPTQVPDKLPLAHAEVKPGDAERPATGRIDIKLPEFKNECLAYVPPNYDPRLSYGVVVWLHAPGGYKADELIAEWKDRCEQQDLILLAPRSADPTKWEPAEAKFVRRALDEVMKGRQIDASRIVAVGQEGGGTLAYVVAVANQDVVRGAVVVAASLPPPTQTPLETEPVRRLAFYVATASKSPFNRLVEAGIKRLTDAKFPVTVKNIGEQPRPLSADELGEVVRWIDTLDRL